MEKTDNKAMNEMEIREMIQEYFKLSSDYTPSCQENLFESGVLDSFGVVEFLTFIQEKFNAEIPIEDITEENFSTIESISNLIVQANMDLKE